MLTGDFYRDRPLEDLPYERFPVDELMADALIRSEAEKKRVDVLAQPILEWAKQHDVKLAEGDWLAVFETAFLAAAKDGEFVAMQIYSCARIGPDGPVAPPPELMTLAHIEYRPQALGASIQRVASMLPDTPILVTENGIATADDRQRCKFTENALRGLHSAVGAGADVRGYIHWSLLDNFEWFSGYTPAFGLIAVDRKTFARTPKPSLAWLGAVARRNAVV